MTSADSQIPIVDIGDLWKDDKSDEFLKVVKTIAEACRDYGFLYIKNHGVDSKLLEDIFSVWRNFVALPQSRKIKATFKGGYNAQRGYLKFQDETTGYLKSSDPDWRESYYTGIDIPNDHPVKKMFPTVTQNNIWPEEPADFKKIVQKYFNSLTELSFRLLSSLAIGLGLKKDFFDPMFTPCPMAVLGMYYYLSHTKSVGPNEFSLGEHTDYGVLTILLQDDVGGLEIVNENDQWIKATPIPGTLVVNLGDMLEVWSNGAYKATKHRVRKSESGGDRISMAFFFEPSPESVITPLFLEKPLISLRNRKPNADIKTPVTYGKYLVEKYKGTGNKNF